MKPVSIVEYVACYISLGWALVLFINPNTFSGSYNFKRIESIVQEEWVLGLLCLIIASIKIVGMLLKKVRLRRIGLIVSATFWVLISVSFLVAGGELLLNTGFIVYSGIAVMCLWASKEVVHIERAD